MGCCGFRRKLPSVSAEQKWEYINLDDFHSTTCWTPLSYGVLYISILISIAVYAVDTFTAVNLLAFDRWSGQIKPYIPMKYSRWIFAGCIILSFVFLFFRWLRAIRVMKGGGVAESYLDPLAVCIQSVRVGKEGRGWKRFLVFAELSKGKRGADYVALFTHYSFEAWLRILFAEGPRQVINALTLYSVMQLNLIPTGDNAAKDGHTPIAQFFVNVGILAEKSGREQAVILFGMLFTLVIWVITLINLMVAVVLYLVFLFHHIPSSDGGLSGYCRRKINQSMEKIVRTKVEKALKKENAIRARQEAREGEGVLKRQPTLPDLDTFASTSDDTPPPLPRFDTPALSEYDSRPGTISGSALTSPSDLERQPTLPDLDSADFHPGPLNRVDTNTSFASNAPLMGSAGGMGYGPAGRMQSPGDIPSPQGYHSRSASNRSYASYSQATQRSYTPGTGQRPSIGHPSRSAAGIYQMGSVSRSGTDVGGRPTPGEQSNPYFPPSSSHPAQGSAVSLPRSNTPGSNFVPSHTSRAPSSTRSITSATPSHSRPYAQPALPSLHTHTSSNSGGYRSYSASSYSPGQSAFTPHTPYRSFTQPNISATSPDYYSPPTPRPPASGYAAQQQQGHMPPSQRPGTAPPTNRQAAPVADNVMEDIMNGY